MEEYTCMIPRETLDGAFYRAVFALHQGNFSRASSVSYSLCYSSAHLYDVIFLHFAATAGHFALAALYEKLLRIVKVPFFLALFRKTISYLWKRMISYRIKSLHLRIYSNRF